MAKGTDKKLAEPGSKRRRTTKRGLAQRDLRLIEKLAAGVAIEEIAASEKISLQWARQRKRAILAERSIDPPHEFIQLQIRRLSEAMLIAYSAMSNGDLRGVDRVVRIARELDRYHGFGPYPGVRSFAARSAEPPPLALPEPPPALAAPEAETAGGASTSCGDLTSCEESAVNRPLGSGSR